ncbi:NAD-dependent epimerase/dehydratase family protein [Virgibacillus flavescens]|uniref:NAD-dependent epimerase/dehydratase family protein n=1 Tax=Virgibacillus flavescens TaxID=1611422 RepID=UPI003D32A030
MDISDKKLLVTGVTGTLGERAAKKFLEEGATVIGLIRDRRNASKLIGLGINPVLGDLANKDSLVDVTENIDIIVHCAAYFGDELDEAIRSNITGVENIASVAKKSDVKKFIHISTTSVYGEPEDGFIEETSPIAVDHEEVYIHTKVRSEQILNYYIGRGLDVTILRPGAICAEENSYWGDRQITRMLESNTVNWVHPDDLVPWIHADNLVEMIGLVIKSGSIGEIYNAIDGNYAEETFRVRLVSALKKKLVVPDRLIDRPIYSNSRIIELGYTPIKSFEQTISNLEKIAVSRLKG